jgi:DNA-binding NtrC family response regulator
MEDRGHSSSTSMVAARHPRLRLLIVGRTKMETVRLPESGDVVVGRGAGCGVIIDDPSVGEQHALLRLGPGLEIVDLGAGPTTVGGVSLSAGQTAAFGPGIVVALGRVTIVAQTSGASARLRHVRTHDYFEGRVEEECARVDQRGGSFAVARFRVEPGAGARGEGPIANSMRPTDVIATYTPEEYELLLLDVGPTEAQAVVDAIVARVRSAGGDARVALACYPRDARTPEGIFAVVGDALHGVAGRPSERPALVPLAAMERLRPIVERVAASVISVIILGETGVGKEVMATTLHALSPRSTKPLVSLNCAAMAETLLESELFGYERGAFTGAVQPKAGLLEGAHGGTVFLDEIGEMSASVQAKLLRVIEQRELTRLGALAPRPIDVRFIAATNRDLEDDVARGTFRADLFFRLNGFTLVIPPLRERVAEIDPLATTFIADACSQAKRSPCPRLSVEALRALQRYSWPGNIRELKNTIQRAVLLCTGDVIEVAHLPIENMGRTLSVAPRPTPQTDFAPVSWGRNRDSTPPPSVAAPTTASDGSDERGRILAVLDRCGGNQTKAAQELGIARGTLIARIEKFAIPRPKKPA